MSLLKYRDVQQRDSRGVTHWTRADIDGAPYRGKQIPLLREAEFEEFAERVKDVKVKMFQLWEPDQLLAYQDVLDKCANNWWTLLKDREMEVREKNSFVVLCIYYENYVEVPPERVSAILG